MIVILVVMKAELVYRSKFSWIGSIGVWKVLVLKIIISDNPALSSDFSYHKTTLHKKQINKLHCIWVVFSAHRGTLASCVAHLKWNRWRRRSPDLLLDPESQYLSRELSPKIIISKNLCEKFRSNAGMKILDQSCFRCGSVRQQHSLGIDLLILSPLANPSWKLFTWNRIKTKCIERVEN